MRLSTFFSILIIYERIWNVTTAANDDYSQLEPEKFDKDRMWFVDAMNTNDNYQFYNVFYYKNLSYCLLIEIYRAQLENPPAKKGLFVNLSYNSLKHWLMRYYGPVHSKFLYLKGEDFINEDFIGCPHEKRLEFVYTDYQNVVVLLGGDSGTGPHVMVLRSNTTNMTYKQRMTLIKLKLKPLLDLKNLKKVGIDDCIAEGDVKEFKEDKLLKCKKFIAIMEEEMKRSIITDMIRKSLLVAIALSGFLCIILNGAWWFIQRKNRFQVAPTQGLQM